MALCQQLPIARKSGLTSRCRCRKRTNATPTSWSASGLRWRSIRLPDSPTPSRDTSRDFSSTETSSEISGAGIGIRFFSVTWLRPSRAWPKLWGGQRNLRSFALLRNDITRTFSPQHFCLQEFQKLILCNKIGIFCQILLYFKPIIRWRFFSQHPIRELYSLKLVYFI